MTHTLRLFLFPVEAEPATYDGSSVVSSREARVSDARRVWVRVEELRP